MIYKPSTAGSALNVLEEAKSILNKKEYYLSTYENNPEYEKPKATFDELPTTYNILVQQVISTPQLGKKPIDPYIAAGMGTEIGGVGVGIVAGVNANANMNKYQEELKSFKYNLTQISNQGQKVAFLVDEIKTSGI